MPTSNNPANAESEQSEALRRLVDRLIALSDFDAEPQIEPLQLAAEEILFEEGQEGNSLYVLKAGVLGVRIRQTDGSTTEIARMAPGALLGEIALLGEGRRSATVYAINPAALVRISQARFQQLLAENKEAQALLKATAAPRWQRNQLAAVLHHLLGMADATILDNIQEEVEWFTYANGDVIFRQGDAPDGLYILINGRLRVALRQADGSEQIIGEISPGEMVGEMAILNDEPRSATVYAVRTSNLVRISPELFQRLTRRYPQLMTQIALTIVERKKETMHGKQSGDLCALNLTLVPAGPSVDLNRFARQLGQAIDKFDSSLVLDAQQFEKQFGIEGTAQTEADDPHHPAIVAWLNELEYKESILLFVADPQLTPWTRRCLGQADRVLIVADPAADPAPGPTEQLLAQMDVPLRSDLLLWHAPQTEWPRGTAAWLDARQVRSHYHVRQGDEAHMDRLARRLTGQAVALVCSGGAARAYAALGVYRAMLELGIPVDFVSGTSMGSIIAGAFALQYSYDQMEAMADWTADYGVTDYTLPLASLMASEKVTRVCQRTFGDHMIEDLWIPYFCVSTNMSTAEPVYHQRGLLWRAIRASMAIPGVYLPVTENDDVLVDGGAMDNFPVRKTIELCETEHVIGVHVSPYKERKRQYDYDMSLSGWRVLLSRINPLQKPLRTPSFLDTMMRAAEVGGVHNGKADEAAVSLLIHPNVRGFSPTNYKAFAQLAQIGYEAALQPLQQWQRRNLSCCPVND